MDEDGGAFFRVRVAININPPLSQGRVITMPKGDKAWINFKYERLPSICYWCGCLDSNERVCDLWVDSKGMLTTEQQQFGPSLRVGKDVIYVPGFYEKTSRRTQTKKTNEDIQAAARAGSASVTPARAVSDMEVEELGSNSNSEAVPELNA